MVREMYHVYMIELGIPSLGCGLGHLVYGQEDVPYACVWFGPTG